MSKEPSGLNTDVPVSKLNFITLMSNGESPLSVKTFLDSAEARENKTDGSIPVTRETEHCWFIKSEIIGLPVQCRKGNEYSLISNSAGFYMFGRDAQKLISEGIRLCLRNSPYCYPYAVASIQTLMRSCRGNRE